MYVSGALRPSEETPQVAWVRRQAVLSTIAAPTMHARVRDMLAFDGRIVHRSYTTDPHQDRAVVYLNALLDAPSS